MRETPRRIQQRNNLSFEQEAKMPSKTQFYAQLAAETARGLTESLQRWTAFLETSARLYKYPLYYREVVFATQFEFMCYTVEDAVDWLSAPTA